MNTVTWLYPAPSCTIPAHHPARAYKRESDISKTWKQYDIGDIRDDYEIVEQTDWLSTPGEFK